MNGREIDRTAGYLLLSRRRGTLLFAQLLANRERIDRLERRNDALADRLDQQSSLLVHALHELALAHEKEPQHFTRKWLSSHRDVVTDQAGKKEARLLA